MVNIGSISFEDIFKDVLFLENIMISIRNDGGVAELRIDRNTPFRVNGQYATIGDEKGSWHVHINTTQVREAKFVIEEKENGNKSYSLRFFNSNNSLVLRVNFMKMYTSDNVPIQESLIQYNRLFAKYGGKELLTLTPPQVS
ncbi:MAG: hemin-degrading factor [Candidatus Nitrosocosmicus sp.]|uniref:hemin-degrading factor n=1 Tax=Candidatus Nitrosocosmicus agrestis TaxID=2563600 RepID=UPI00122E74C8|nr:hemin-degrading factor [Candidatus Nitrosocosmicus sp. SS]MDR4492780.1 hemin-degrading factor [Candidatus Nitrosocosmicus sp.]HET8794302.1 hemin-degrading factor [Nitrososphaeraceae archaeon]KAA2280453.1 hemin-degrading factor [Candidatus Nitrosocosmicus sp. SS]KAF0869231.1 hemin-degrading factor [Candidatus Nitrosocosmicus sp. SS]HET6590433.1 hemin-degrading factor [Candidatus Nitrosocosmicus sp.]